MPRAQLRQETQILGVELLCTLRGEQDKGDQQREENSQDVLQLF